MEVENASSRQRFSTKKIAAVTIGGVLISGIIVYQYSTILSLLKENQRLEHSLQQKEQELEETEDEFKGALKVPYMVIKEGSVTQVFQTAEGAL